MSNHISLSVYLEPQLDRFWCAAIRKLLFVAWPSSHPKPPCDARKKIQTNI